MKAKVRTTRRDNNKINLRAINDLHESRKTR